MGLWFPVFLWIASFWNFTEEMYAVNIEETVQLHIVQKLQKGKVSSNCLHIQCLNLFDLVKSFPNVRQR